MPGIRIWEWGHVEGNPFLPAPLKESLWQLTNFIELGLGVTSFIVLRTFIMLKWWTMLRLSFRLVANTTQVLNNMPFDASVLYSVGRMQIFVFHTVLLRSELYELLSALLNLNLHIRLLNSRARWVASCLFNLEHCSGLEGEVSNHFHSPFPTSGLSFWHLFTTATNTFGDLHELILHQFLADLIVHNLQSSAMWQERKWKQFCFSASSGIYMKVILQGGKEVEKVEWPHILHFC